LDVFPFRTALDIGFGRIFNSGFQFFVFFGGLSAIESLGKTLQFIAAIDVAAGLARIAPSIAPLAAIAPELIALGLVFGVLALEAKAYYDIHAEKTALNKSIQESTQAYQAGLAELKDTYQDITQRTGVAINSTAEFHDLVENGTLVLDKANGKWTTSADLLNSISKATGITVKSQDELNRALASGLIVFDQATGKYTSHDQQIAELAKNKPCLLATVTMPNCWMINANLSAVTGLLWLASITILIVPSLGL